MRALTLALAVVAVGAGACTRTSVQQTPSPSPSSPASTAPPASASPGAAAELRDGTGKSVGSITLTDTYAGVVVAGTVSGLGLGAHGIHIHEIGKCEAPFASAGAHFNPAHRQHGYRNPNGPHLGDLPNIDTPAAGPLKFEFLLSGVTLTGTNALLDADGAAVVVHAARDDYATDPSGGSGGRIACGVITAR